MCGHRGPHQRSRLRWRNGNSSKAAKLWGTPVDNRARTLAWRLMHGNLPCDMYRKSHGCANVSGACNMACCAESQPWASLEHIFVHCPAYDAARAWLANTWHAISGHLPPLNAAVLLGDCSTAWPSYPSSPSRAEVWNALRLSWLMALWETHTQLPPSLRSSHEVIVSTVLSLRQLIRAQFCLCCTEQLIFAVLPGRVLTRTIVEATAASFNSRWGTNSVLCAAATAHDGSCTLQLYLDLQHPVSAAPPPLPPQPPPPPPLPPP
jgi:hypothetical protein